MTNPRYQPLLAAAVILVTAWVLAWIGMRVADHYKMTAEKMIVFKR